MGAAARERSLGFSWDKTMARFLGYYRDVLAARAVKIVDVCEFYSPTGGGVQRYVEQKLELAPRFGHDMTILAPGPETKMEKFRGGTIAWVKSPYLPFDHNYRMFWGADDVWRSPGRTGPRSRRRIVALARRLAGGALAGQGAPYDVPSC